MEAHDLLLLSPLLIAVAMIGMMAIRRPAAEATTPTTPKPVYCQHQTSTFMCKRIQHPACRSGLCARCCAALGCDCMVVDQPVPEGTK